MARIHPKICANCAYWDCFEVKYDFAEDECGACKMNDREVVFGDQEGCENFKNSKRPRVRAEDYWG